MKENLLVIFGGESCEHDISIISAIQAIKNVDENYYNIIPIYITKSGIMLTGKKLTELSSFSNFNTSNLTEVSFIVGKNYLYYKTLLGYKQKVKADVALIVMHGINGEDGKIMSLLELSKIPYTACSPLQSELCMDKCVFKDYLKGLKINVVNGVSVFSYEYALNPETVKNFITDVVSFPLIVKPATLGSSIGIKVCNNVLELENALKLAFTYCNKVLIEEFLEDVTEVNLAILGYENDITLSVTEQPIKQNEFLTFDNKYVGNSAKGMANLKRIVPADVSTEVSKEIKNIAKRIFTNLNLKGVVRFDFMVDNKTNKVYVNELNTIPGSLAYYLFSPININYKTLINKLIKFAYVSFDNNNKLIKTFSSSVLDKTELANGVKK